MVPDPLLQGIALAAEQGTSIGVTLYVPGMIVSGLVIGRKEWSEAYVQSIASGSTSAGTAPSLILDWTVEQQVKLTTLDAPRPAL